MRTHFLHSLQCLLLIVVLLQPVLILAQLSPGELSEAHAHLEGLSNCTKCHVLNQKVSNEKCLECHTMLKQRIEAGKGYHSSNDIAGKACIICHSEHHGRKFEMIRFDTTQFNHMLTGYRLEGAHARVSCAECHTDEHIPNPEVRKLRRTFLGLQTDCLNCHEDFHRNSLPANCLECHSYETFKQAPNFNHDKADFILKGKHREVACEKCHLQENEQGKSSMVFKGLEFSNCTDCHTDVHQNKFGQDCRSCHTENSFHEIIGMNTFDHGRTGYPLEGKHRYVACEKCHPSAYSDPLPHARCMDCHTDFHEGQLQRSDYLPDCSACHTVQGFRPAQFTVEDHQRGDFQLEGAHLATPCFSCHKKQEKWQFRNIGLLCADCHEDIHQPYLNSKYYPEQDCKKCHSPESWKQIGFDHALTDYPLTGAHRGPSCRACHQSTSENGNPYLLFTGIPSNCLNCHEDQHAGQFMERGTVDCARCHENINWKATKFDHDKSRFVLDGSHNKLSCGACHKPAEINGKLTIQYKFEDIRCESCH